MSRLKRCRWTFVAWLAVLGSLAPRRGHHIARAVHGVAVRAQCGLDTLDLTHDPAWSTFSST